MKHDKIIIGITQGDTNGIGYEVIIKTLMEPKITEDYIVVVYGSSKIAAYHRKALNCENFNFHQIRNVDELNAKRPNIINCCDENLRVELGKPSAQAGEAAYLALKAAVDDLKKNKIDVLVTAPFNKHTIAEAEFKYPGHTEYLQQEFGQADSLMFMVSDYLKVGVVTGHIPLANVAQAITPEKVFAKLKMMNDSLVRDFAIRRPRIAVLGLNPHAGDNGLLGTEDDAIIAPVIKKAREANMLAYGPFAADGFFGSGQFSKFDGILAMYHDQGLIPFKTLVDAEGINFTAGLPMVRTSPAHGTAFEIAGKDEASPDSFRAALFMACDIFRNRQMLDELKANPMKNYDITNI